MTSSSREPPSGPALLTAPSPAFSAPSAITYWEPHRDGHQVRTDTSLDPDTLQSHSEMSPGADRQTPPSHRGLSEGKASVLSSFVQSECLHLPNHASWWFSNTLGGGDRLVNCRNSVKLKDFAERLWSFQRELPGFHLQRQLSGWDPLTLAHGLQSWPGPVEQTHPLGWAPQLVAHFTGEAEEALGLKLLSKPGPMGWGPWVTAKSRVISCRTQTHGNRWCCLKQGCYV